jgi:4'-phosphopantetheinyl transferase EntD
MPQILELEPDAGSRLAVWKIEEEAEELKWMLQWGQSDIMQYRSHADSLRSMHWLSSRVLLRKMLNTSKFIDLQVDEFGKPYLRNFPQKLSISHSNQMVTVLLSERECGIDIELMKPKIEKVAHKFISEEEWKYLTEEFRMEEMYVFWSVKEALYKYYGKKKLEFRKNIFLYPFEWKEKNTVRTRIEKGSYLVELPVSFRKLEDYILAYVIVPEAAI